MSFLHPKRFRKGSVWLSVKISSDLRAYISNQRSLMCIYLPLKLSMILLLDLGVAWGSPKKEQIIDICWIPSCPGSQLFYLFRGCYTIRCYRTMLSNRITL